MKTPLLVCSLLMAAAPAWSAEPAHACCTAPAAVSKPACCANESAATAPLADRSIYQLDATWTTDRNQRMTLAQLRGKPVVLAMFFASCEYACPVIVSDMQRLRAALPAEVRADTRFVLVSFDDVRDTPDALKAYRERAHLDEGWTLLHGEPGDLQELAMALGVRYRQDARGQFSHSNLITILNAAGEIAHQRTGLQGEVLTAARAVRRATR